jgi:hypothetical protein
MVPLVIQSFLEDLKSSNEFYQAMALHAIGSISGRELAEAVHAPVEALAHSATTPLAVRKKVRAQKKEGLSPKVSCFTPFLLGSCLLGYSFPEATGCFCSRTVAG